MSSSLSSAARALGWDSWLGTLEAGKAADLIVVDSNPLEDLRILADKAHLQFVMKEGQVAACHAGSGLPSEQLAKHVLLIQ